MTKEEIEKYWYPARSVVGRVLHPPVENDNASYTYAMLLADLLDLNYPTPNYATSIQLTDKLKSKLEMIAGPHGEAIIKAMVAKHDT